MNSLWITYSWKDNEDSEVDFIAQELEKEGIQIKLDKWNIKAGGRLWEQIEKFIMDPNESDAWLFIASDSSLGSEKCKEEFYYALERALESRGKNFPLITLFKSSIDKNLLPAGVRIRLYVSITDPNWKARIISAVKGEPQDITRKNIEPYIVRIHEFKERGSDGFSIEIRPRVDVWNPVFMAVSYQEKEKINPVLRTGPPGYPPRGGAEFNCGSYQSDDGSLWIMTIGTEVTPSKSAFLFVNGLPSAILFGTQDHEKRYSVSLR